MKRWAGVILALVVTWAMPMPAGSLEGSGPFGYPLGFSQRDIVCTGTHRVQLVYGYVKGTSDRYSAVVDEWRQAVYDASGVLKTEAEWRSRDRYGLRLQLACNSTGKPTVLRAGAFRSSEGEPSGYLRQLCDKGFTRSDRIYWLALSGSRAIPQARAFCGTRMMRVAAAVPVGYPLVGSPLVDATSTVHEGLHTLGAVASKAPHYYGYHGSHCTDGRDVMCYGPEERRVCADRIYVDCNGDDYFNPTPRSGSWLANNPAANIALCSHPFSNCAFVNRGHL